MPEPQFIGPEQPQGPGESLSRFAETTFATYDGWGPDFLASQGIEYRQVTDPGTGALTRTAHYDRARDTSPIPTGQTAMLSATGFPDRPAEMSYAATAGGISVAWISGEAPHVTEDLSGQRQPGEPLGEDDAIEMSTALMEALFVMDHGIVDMVRQRVPAELSRSPRGVRRFLSRLIGSLGVSFPAGEINEAGVAEVVRLSRQDDASGPSHPDSE